MADRKIPPPTWILQLTRVSNGARIGEVARTRVSIPASSICGVYEDPGAIEGGCLIDVKMGYNSMEGPLYVAESYDEVIEACERLLFHDGWRPPSETPQGGNHELLVYGNCEESPDQRYFVVEWRDGNFYWGPEPLDHVGAWKTLPDWLPLRESIGSKKGDRE